MPDRIDDRDDSSLGGSAPGLPERRWRLTVRRVGREYTGGIHLFDVRSVRLPAVPLLDADEQARARRFVHERDRRSFEACRTRLRQLLGQQLGRPPEAIALGTDAHRKPILVGAPELQFNLSHSGHWGLIAWLGVLPVGVDIEVWRELPDRDELVKRYFSPAERAAYHALPTADRQGLFYALWAHKEALIKADGRGLAIPLDSFDVTFRDGRPFLDRTSSPLDARWSIATLVQGPGCSAAIAAQGDAVHIGDDGPAGESVEAVWNSARAVSST